MIDEIKRATINTMIDRHYRYSPTFSQGLGEFVIGNDGLEPLYEKGVYVKLYQEEYNKVDIIYRDLYSPNLSDEENMIVTKCAIEFGMLLVLYHYAEIFTTEYDLHLDNFLEYYHSEFMDHLEVAETMLYSTYSNLKGKLTKKFFDVGMHINIMMDIYYMASICSDYATPIGWIGRTNVMVFIGD